jgi:hypothetical protein
LVILYVAAKTEISDVFSVQQINGTAYTPRVSLFSTFDSRSPATSRSPSATVISTALGVDWPSLSGPTSGELAMPRSARSCCSTRDPHPVGSIDSSWIHWSARSSSSIRGSHSAGNTDSSWIHRSARHCYCKEKVSPYKSPRKIYPVLLEQRICAFKYTV